MNQWYGKGNFVMHRFSYIVCVSTETNNCTRQLFFPLISISQCPFFTSIFKAVSTLSSVLNCVPLNTASTLETSVSQWQHRSRSEMQDDKIQDWLLETGKGKTLPRIL